MRPIKWMQPPAAGNTVRAAFANVLFCVIKKSLNNKFNPSTSYQLFESIGSNRKTFKMPKKLKSKTKNKQTSKVNRVERPGRHQSQYQIQSRSQPQLPPTSGVQKELEEHEDNWLLHNAKTIKSILLNDISYESVINLSGLLSGLYFGVSYGTFLLNDIEGSILIEKRNNNEFGLNASESCHFFGEGIVTFITIYGIVLTFLVILKLPRSLRPPKTSLIDRGSNNQCTKILTTSATIMALYASAFPVMLLVKDIAISITKRRESTGTTGRVATSELAGFMAWTLLLVMAIFFTFALLIIMSIVITNTILRSQMKIPDEESGGQDNTEPLPVHHDLASTSNSIASCHCLGAGLRPGSGSGSGSNSSCKNVKTSVRDSGVKPKALTGHESNSPMVSAVVGNSEGPAQDVSGPGTTPDQRVPEIESVSQIEDLQSEGSGSITKRRKSA
jgi:hypothetical protein